MAEEKNQEMTEETVETIFEEETEVNSSEQIETKEKEESDANDALEELQKKLDESENRYLRLRADFDNFRRRVQIDREANEKYKAQSLVTNLLPAIDNFERAMQITPEDEQAKQLMQGVEMVYRNIIDALKKEGVEVIEAVGKEFDPNFHQAIMQGEDENFDSNIVIEEFQKGYILKDRVIRPSMVKVNQ
ncbi:nucleotide exchange factor GrpE [Heyndrickxia oleronia]|uniref:nucleotide exchange factor GrpE n=1 Tax=Heyndrickxia oleronia TaxID=38875 RepID=UPI00203D3E70|nr:nucleotide exchange factor GrpE [Heyndrickxia oleronia]MCM3237058.1 nucleotide exchange factor GrpE [Heyndrickxia oleronia]